jgi:hypothetical protein
VILLSFNLCFSEAPTILSSSQGPINDKISSYQKSAATACTIWQTSTVALAAVIIRDYH